MAAARAGDHETAWQIADHVLKARDPARRDDPTLPYHLRWVWDGRSFRNRDVLVRCYHGLGDTIQFVRFLPALAAAARAVTLEVQPALLPLLAHLPVRLTPFNPAAPSPPAECDMDIMELSHALRLPPEAAKPPYLQTTPNPTGATGLCWQAGDWDPARSIPAELLAPLLSRPVIALHPRPAPPPFLNPNGCPPDIAETAALLAGLRDIITVDTMLAHLAGALNLPAWLLLKHTPDWRWGHHATTPWYPALRLRRQPAPGNWRPVIAALAAALGVRGGQARPGLCPQAVARSTLTRDGAARPHPPETLAAGLPSLTPPSNSSPAPARPRATRRRG
jgi:hypothetical protein